MYVTDFEAFLAASEKIFVGNPEKTRYVIKYRSCAGVLVLKVTDNVKCIKFKTNQHADIKHADQLSALFFRLTTSSK